MKTSYSLLPGQHDLRFKLGSSGIKAGEDPLHAGKKPSLSHTAVGRQLPPCAFKHKLDCNPGMVLLRSAHA